MILDQKRLTTGKCEGPKSHAETNPEMVQIAKGLRRRKRGNSLRAIAAELAARGYVNVNGREYSAASVASMLSRIAQLDQRTALPDQCLHSAKTHVRPPRRKAGFDPGCVKT
jgi:hypothetical protein